MKTLLLRLLAVGAMLAAPLASHAAERVTRPVTLQVSAHLPASANIIRDADIAETFGYLIATKLREQGLRGRISYLDEGMEPVAGVSHLSLNLVEWRVSPLGNVDCSFNATLTTVQGTKSLGFFTGSSLLAWPFGSWSAREDAFERAATEPVSDLLKKIRESRLLPDGA